MKRICYLSFLLLFLTTITAHAQTLVNQLKVDTVARAVTGYSYIAATVDSATGQYLLVDNYSNGQAAVGHTDGPQWITVVNSNLALQNYMAAISYKNGYVYVTGFLLDAATSKAGFYTAKLNAVTGDTVFTRTYHGAYNGYDVAASVLADDSGNVYVAGTEQVGVTDFRMALIKYSPTGALLWTSYYDSTGLYDGAVGMALNPGSNIVITGYSGTGFGNWDLTTVWLGLNGTRLSIARSPNGSGNFSQQPVAIMRDAAQSIVVIGTAGTTPGNSQIKLVQYDSTFHQTNVKVYGDSSSVITATGAANDGDGHILIAGTASNIYGGKDVIAFCVNHGNSQQFNIDTLYWTKRISAPNPAWENSAAAITTDNTGNAIIAGRVFNGADFDISTIALNITQNGNLQWVQHYDAGGSNDKALAVTVDDDNNVYTYGSSALGIDTTLVKIKYGQATAFIPADSLSANNPFAFYENRGQLFSTDTMRSADSIFYYTNAGNPQLFVGSGKVSYVMGFSDSTHSKDSIERFDMWLSNNNQKEYSKAKVFTDKPANAFINYYLGYMAKPALKVTGTNRIVQKDVYDGVDWHLCSSAEGIKNYFVIYPGSSAGQIDLQFKGADSIRLPGNAMQVFNHAGYLQFDTLIAFTVDSAGDTARVSVSYNTLGSYHYGFTLGAYNNNNILVIESNLKSLQRSASLQGIKWSTYFGGSGSDYAGDVRPDFNHHLYITGGSASRNLPSTTGVNTVAGFNQTAFLSQFNDDGSLQWSVYYGGSNNSSGFRIAVNSTGNVFVCGSTSDSNFPNVAIGSAYQSTQTGSFVAPVSYIAEFQSVTVPGITAGTMLWKTYFDGNQRGLAFDASDNLYMVGGGASSNFPSTTSSLCTSGNCFQYTAGKGCITKFNPALQITWATTFGDDNTSLLGLTVNTGDATTVYAVGETDNITSMHFRLKSAGTEYTQAFAGATDGLILKFDGNDNLLYSAFIGGDKKSTGAAGTGVTILEGVAGGHTFDGPTNRVYMCGFTNCTDLPTKDQSGSSHFQGTKYQPTGADNDAIFISFNTDNEQLYTTYYGGSDEDGAYQIISANSAAAPYGAAYMVGGTLSDDLPIVSPGGYFSQPANASPRIGECFITSFQEGSLLWSTYIGGTNEDGANSVATQGNNLFVVGVTTNTQVPVAANGYPLLNPGSPTYFQGDLNLTSHLPTSIPEDAFITEFDLTGTPTDVYNITESENTLLVYPNPATDYIRLISPNYNGQKLLIEILDVLGQNIYTMYISVARYIYA